MSVDLSALSLFPATAEQITEARRRSLSEWGKGLTLDEHLARDASQDQFDGSRDGRLVTWYPFTNVPPLTHLTGIPSRVLAPRNDPQTLKFKCACET
jgi:hypothetical protein